MFARVTKDGLFADGWGAGWYEGCMNELASTTKSLREGVWAIAHEFGHVNQIRPGLKWVSTTEVTNNVYSVCARYKFYRENMPLEHERCNDGNDNNVRGGRLILISIMASLKESSGSVKKARIIWILLSILTEAITL